MPPSVMSSPLPVIEPGSPVALRAAVIVLGLLAGVSVAMSALPLMTLALIPVLAWACWPAAPAWRSMVFLAGRNVALDASGEQAEALLLQRRGPLTVITLRVHDKLRRVVLTTPGTLRADQRRLLSLWFARDDGAPSPDAGAAHV